MKIKEADKLQLKKLPVDGSGIQAVFLRFFNELPFISI